MGSYELVLGGAPLPVGLDMLFLVYSLDVACTTRSCTRGAVVDLRIHGRAINAILRGLGGRSKFSFFFGGGRMSLGHVMSISTGGGGVFGVLSRVFTKAGIGCSILRGGVVLSARVIRKVRRRRGGIANVIGSGTNVPVINTAVVRGKDAGNAISSLSKGFDLRVGDRKAVLVSCVNCVARRVGIGGGSGLVVALRRSARALSRMIIMNCNTVRGHSMSATVSAMGKKGVSRVPASGVSRDLINVSSNVALRRVDKRPKTTPTVQIQKTNSVGDKGSPLFMVSNCPAASTRLFGGVGPTSVTSVRVLGSTTSSTVCNSGTKGNMVVIAAGRKRAKGPGIDFSARMK